MIFGVPLIKFDTAAAVFAQTFSPFENIALQCAGVPEIVGGKVAFGVGLFKAAVGNKVGGIRFKAGSFHRGVENDPAFQLHHAQGAFISGTAIDIVGKIVPDAGVVVTFGGKTRHFKEQTL